MPVYEYVCRTCDSRFEARRSMDDASAPIDCPDGHSETTRLLSVFASVGRAAAGPGYASSMAGTSGAVMSGAGGGCCGGGCGCGS
jgi:putative FmdB family regulatory protein